MMYTKKDFGRELTDEINKEFDADRLSTWAHYKYLDHASTIDEETYNAIMTVIFISEGEGFEKTRGELLKLASCLQKIS